MLTLETTIAFTVVFILLLGILGFFIDIAMETYAAIEMENSFLETVNGVPPLPGNGNVSVPQNGSGLIADIEVNNLGLLKRYKSHETFTIENGINTALGEELAEVELERRDYKFNYRRMLLLKQYVNEAANLFRR